MPKRRLKKLKIRVEKNKKTSQTDNRIILEKEVSQDPEKEKLLLMRVGVACIMVIFFVAWIFNLKYQFKANADNKNKTSFSWEQTRAELDKAMGQIKQGISEIKKIQATNNENTLPKEPELTAEQIDLLKGKLLNEIVSSTTASSTIK